MSISFLDAPPTIARSGRTRTPEYTEFAEQAKANPGKWALLANDISISSVKKIKDGTWAEFTPAGEYDAVSRNAGETGKGDIWVAYIGPTDEPVALPGV
jgi:hypothetical protein